MSWRRLSFFALWVAAVTNWAKTENNEGKEKPTAGEVVREACRLICKVGQVERVPEFYSEDFEADYPMTERGRGLPGVAALAESVRNILPGYAEHIDELVEAGYEVVVRLTITGNEPRKGAGVSFRDVSMLTVRNGKICRQRGLTDYLSLYLQLGLVQMPGRLGGTDSVKAKRWQGTPPP